MSLQRYVSDELTHFVGRSFRHEYNAHEKQYQLLVRILRSGVLGKDLDRRVHYQADKRFSDNQFYRSNLVCFSDIPVPDLGIHMGKFSRFGLAFPKSLLIERGANPVYYVARNGRITLPDGRQVNLARFFEDKHHRLWRYFQAQSKNPEGELSLSHDKDAKDDPDDLFAFLVYNFFSYVKFYDEGLASDDDKNYYMEREWRIHGNLEFSLSDVRRVVFPERFARSFREDLPEYYGEITFS